MKQAQQAYAARKLVDLERAAREVPSNHVLAPYVEYWRLMLDSRTEDGRITDFLARYPGSRLTEALRADWLKSLGARETWPAFLAEYPRLVTIVRNGRRATAAMSVRRFRCGLPDATCRRPAPRCLRCCLTPG